MHRMDQHAIALRIDRDRDFLHALPRGGFVRARPGFGRRDDEAIAVAHMHGDVAAAGGNGHMRARRKRLRRNRHGLRIAFMKRRQVEIDAGDMVAKPIAKHETAQHNREQDKQNRFAARKQARARTPGAARQGNTIQQFGHTPQDQQNRPVQTHQTPDVEAGVDAIEKE